MSESVGTTRIGVLAALEAELGGLPSLARPEPAGGSARANDSEEVGERARAERPAAPEGFGPAPEVLELELAGVDVRALVCGVGKVHAARGAALLLEQELDCLLVVGTCGALRRGLAVGDLVHCTTSFQADLALRDGRRVEADGDWRADWRAVAPGPEGWFLTADRPVLTPWRRLRLARAFAGPCVADMETAAAARVAELAGVPFAALRAVTDRAGLGTAAAFKQNYPAQAGRAADSIAMLLEHRRARRTSV